LGKGVRHRTSADSNNSKPSDSSGEAERQRLDVKR